MIVLSSPHHPARSRHALGRARLTLSALAGIGPLLATSVFVALGGCAPIPPPDILAELERTREAPAVVAARSLVPSAFDEAESLRAEANRALEEGDFSGAQILGEQARAAYALTVAAARVARAQQNEAEALAEADAIAIELASLDAEQQQVAADVAALQLRMAALSGAGQAGSGAQPSTPEEAAKALAALRVQARLLCTAARLLAPPASSAAPASTPMASGTRLGDLEARLRGSSEAPSLEQAVELRQACARELSEIRRATQAQAPSSAQADRLLVALSQVVPGGVGRDERGVVVTLRPPFAAGRLGASDASTLASVGKVAREHPGFPVVIVVHDAEIPSRSRPTAAPGAEQRGEQLVAALGMKASVELAGTAQPLLPEGRYQARNERVEVVFVSPAPE